MHAQNDAITRREVLKKGALVGGAVLWVTPIVQTVGMSRAYASSTSPECPIHCIKWHHGGTGGSGYWTASIGDKCLPRPFGAIAGLPPHIGDFAVAYDVGTRICTVSYPDTYSLVPPTISGDDLVEGSAAIRHDGNAWSCSYLTNRDEQPGDSQDTTQIRFTNWTVESGDCIELVIKHCI